MSGEPNPDAKTLSITIKCLRCNNKLPSPIFMTPYSSFSTATLIGNEAQCPSCHKMTRCNKDNFLARFDGGGFVGDNSL
jgi:late competence protein required for DNA uptake (superfamily II DNA/RNA helicase)